MIELEVQSRRGRRGSVMREAHSADSDGLGRGVSHFLLTILLQISRPAFHVSLMLDGKRVSNQPVKTD